MEYNIGNFILEKNSLDDQQISRLRQIHEHFTQDVLHDLVEPLVENGSPFSLRSVDWAAVNYSKRFPVEYVVKDSIGHEMVWSMHSSYRSWLKNYRRKCFDIFRRRSRIFFIGKQGKRISTTVAQINFILWMKIHNVVEWCMKNHKMVEKNMVETLTQSRKERILKKRRKRSELVKSNSAPQVIHRKRRIVFDD